MSNDTPITNKKVNQATAWSFAGECAAKLMAPLSNMILARILAPQVFGVIATVNMVISLSDIFTEAGFQLYLIQHDFKSREELKKYASSALWVSVLLSLAVFGIIAIFRDTFAVWIGSPGYGDVVAVTSISIPIAAGISVLQALYKRDLNYKHLFIRRFLGLLVPLVVTVPLAFLGWGVWALAIGILAGKVVNLLTLMSNKNYLPSFYCNIRHVIEMAPFCVATLINDLLVWAVTWVDVLFIGHYLNSHYTGLYKNAQATVAGVLGMFAAALTPVLFSVLCRCATDNTNFVNTLKTFTNRIGIILLPIGFGMFACCKSVTYILLGSQWGEAATFVGIWGLCVVLNGVYSTYCREACKAKGKPHLSAIAQGITLLLIIPSSLYGVRAGFDTLIWIRSLISLAPIPIYLILLSSVLKLNPFKWYQITVPYLISAITMATVIILLQKFVPALWFEFILIPFGAVIYFGILFLFPNKRQMLIGYIHTGTKFVRKIVKRGK